MIKKINNTTIINPTINKEAITIDTCQFDTGEYETMALLPSGDELDCITSITESDAITAFDSLVLKYANPLQKKLYSVGMKKGKRYTIVDYSLFGFPTAKKITFEGLNLCTYAQYKDAVKITYRRFRSRKNETHFFVSNESLMIFEGWQDIPDTVTHIITRDDDIMRTKIARYSCYDSRYFDDIERYLAHPLVIYKNCKTGKNGKLYA